MAAAAPVYPQLLLRYTLPRMKKPIPFDKIFRYEDRGTSMTLQALSQKRSDIQVFLDTPNAPSEGGIKLIEDYLPYLWGLQTSVASQEDLRTYTPLQFIWLGGIEPRKKEISSLAVFVEIGMILSTLGYLHCNAAYEAMAVVRTATEFDENSKVASAHLRAAAGVFDFAFATLQFKFPVGEYDSRPTECVPELLQALSIICVAQAQQLGIRKAADNVKMKKSLVAQICADTYKKFDAAEHILKPVPHVAPGIRSFCGVNALLYRVACMKFQGCACYDEEKYGLSAAYLSGALEQARQLEYLPEADRWMRMFVDPEMSEVRTFYTLFAKENRSVYYEKEPPVSELEIPPARALVSGGTFVQPQPAFTQIL